MSEIVRANLPMDEPTLDRVDWQVDIQRGLVVSIC